MTKNPKIEFETKLIDKSKKHTIFIGDALEILDTIKGTPFKLIFADPPYNMGKKFGNNNDKWLKPEDYRDWCISWIKKCIDKLADDGSIMIMGHPRYSSYLIPFLDKNLIYTNQIIYYYTDGMPERKNFEIRYEVI